MADIGIDFDADVFRVTVSPLRLRLKNAHLTTAPPVKALLCTRRPAWLTMQNLYAWQLSRDISIDTTDITGAEVWVKFDSEGRSIFKSETRRRRGGSRVNFKYESIVFSPRQCRSLRRCIEKNSGRREQRRFPSARRCRGTRRTDAVQFDLPSTESKFIYDERPLDPIDLRAVGIADRMGADITEFRLTTPIGTSSLSGQLTSWASLKYDLNIESTVDLTQASSIFLSVRLSRASAISRARYPVRVNRIG